MTFDADRIVQRLYDAADESADLHDLLRAMGGAVGTDRAHYIVVSTETGAPVEMRFIGGDASGFEEYEQWRAQDPRFLLAVARAGEALIDADLPDLAAYERSTLLNEKLIREGTRYSLFATKSAGPSLVVAQAFLRQPHQAPFGEEERRRMQMILPHLARATRLRHIVRALRRDLGDLERALDAVPSALAVLEARGRVVVRNAAFRELLCAHPTLLEDRRVAAAIASATTFADARASKPSKQSPPRTVSIVRADGPPLAVLVHPLRATTDLRRATPSARVLVVVHDPSRVVRLRPALIAEVHGLTSTEAELAAAIAEGRSVADFAKARKTSELTARTHLKRILEKTGARRQPELVCILLSAAALHSVSS